MDVILGIDVSSNELETHILANSQINNATKTFANTVKGCSQVIAYVNKNKITSVVMEATGGYEQKMAQLCLKKNITVKIVNPLQVRSFARGIGKIAKTDKIDAFVIAKFAQIVNTPALLPKSQEEVLLLELVKRRDSITRIIVAEKNRIRLAGKFLKKIITKSIKYFEKEVVLLDKEMNRIRLKSTEISEKCEILCKQKGVARLTALRMIALMPEIGLVNRKQIAALAGLAPMAKDSGKMKGKRFIYGGRFGARKAIYMSAWVAVQYDTKMTVFYEKLIARGKAPKVAIVAVMRRLIVMLNGMIREQFYNKQQSLN